MRKLGLALLVLTCLGLGYALVRAQPVTMPPPPGTSATLCVFNTVLPTMNSGFPGYIQCDVNGRAIQSGGAAGAAGYPAGAVPVAANQTGTTAPVGAILPAAVGKFTYICGYSVNETATAPTNGAGSISNLVGGGWVVQFGVGTAPAMVITQQTFTPCIPTSATNLPIQLTSAAAGTGGVQTLYVWGYQL